MLVQMPGTGERFEMILYRVAVCTGRFSGCGHGDAPALAAQLQNLYRQLGQVAKKQTFSLNLFQAD